MSVSNDRIPETASKDSRCLAGAWNFRDVAGAVESRFPDLVPDRLYRSSTLSGLKPDGRNKLDDLGVATVVDLRYAGERKVVGEDLVSSTVSVVHRPFSSSASADAVHELPVMKSDEQRCAHMTAEYRRFVTYGGARAAILSVVEFLIDPVRRPVLVHCAAGKDRTGWVCAVVLEAAGVSRDTIAADFVASNDAIDDLRAVMQSGAAGADLSEFLIGVRPEYLEAAFDEVQRRFGSMNRYLDVIGVSADMRREIGRVLHR